METMADPEKDKETQETQETQPETELEKELKSEHNHNGDGVAHEAAETENSRAETASIAEASDEQDTFEDATDLSVVEPDTAPPTSPTHSRTRSLTKRRSSVKSVTSNRTAEDESHELSEVQAVPLTQASEDSRSLTGRPSTAKSLESNISAEEDLVELPPVPAAAAASTHTTEDTRSLTERPSTAKSLESNISAEDELVELPPVPAAPSTQAAEQPVIVEDAPSAQQPNSPLLTSHRLSSSSLADIQLEEEPLKSPKLRDQKPEPPPRASSKSNVNASKSSLTGLSGVLPSVPWAAPPQAPVKENLATPAPAPSTRKLTSPFSWLSRNASTPKETVVSPPLPSPTRRRDTASSLGTIGSNSDMMTRQMEDADAGSSGRLSRNSLRDRFKLLRMREEAGITELPDEGETGGKSLGFTHTTITSAQTAHGPLSPGMPSSPNPSIINTALAPGTVSGVAAGPPAVGDAVDVDWDLWQNVVYEGPAAVARTSPEELNRAIASGIPSAIRGVVWQVLAQSQNAELEGVYRELVSRGTEKDKDRLSRISTLSGTQSNGSSAKESVVSSASSIHSDRSTPTTANGMRSPSPPNEKDIEAMAKAQAASIAEAKARAKADAAALQKLEKAIKRDLGTRTSYSKFAASAGLQDGLFGVCKAYALYDEGVGYAQGMNFLVMPLLFNMAEEEAFCLLVRLMNNYHLRDLFIQDMPGLHMHLYQFERLLEDFEPALYCHLHRRQVTPHLYATQWFLTLFAYRFPLQLVLRIYDLILSEGLEAILKFGIVLMQKNAETLLGMNDMMALTNFLKDKLFDVYIDKSPTAGSILENGFFGSSGASMDKEVYRADHLIEDACAVKITPEILKTYTIEWEEKTKMEKDREAELESLKSSNVSLLQKVRGLEERVQGHDGEHAALATELVKAVMRKEELEEQNEELSGKVEELKGVVDKLPAEVEARLQSEMDRLMKTNLDVHSENSKLEEEMAEMERELVETKMKYAEVNAQHETLLRKWTDLKKAMG